MNSNALTLVAGGEVGGLVLFFSIYGYWDIDILCCCFIVADDSPDCIHTVLSVRF